MTDSENNENAFTLKIITEIIKSGESVCFTGTGNSMLPTINPETDKIILSPVNRRLKKGDICFYLREENKPVTHRIYKIKKDRYCMKGDNQYWLEKDVPEENIIAVATKIIRNGKEIPLDGNFTRYKAHLKAVKKRVVIFIKGKIHSAYLAYKKMKDSRR